MITCPKCQSVNPADAASCSQCGTDLLSPPTFGERVIKNLAWIIIFFFALAASFFINIALPPENTAFIQICLAVIVLVLLVVLFVGLFKKHPLSNLYLDRAKRHLNLDRDQAQRDFINAFQATPPVSRFSKLLSFFPEWNLVDPDNAQLNLINLIRITPVRERQSMGQKYPKRMANLEQQLEAEARDAETAGNQLKAARKHLYSSYFVEAKIATMFQVAQTSDLVEAMMDGAKKGWQQSSFIGTINNLRNNMASAQTAATLFACEKCQQLVDPDHDPKHKKKVYPIFLIPDEIDSVKQAFNEKYSLFKK